MSPIVSCETLNFSRQMLFCFQTHAEVKSHNIEAVTVDVSAPPAPELVPPQSNKGKPCWWSIVSNKAAKKAGHRPTFTNQIGRNSI
jgi:hypothetical protein